MTVAHKLYKQTSDDYNEEILAQYVDKLKTKFEQSGFIYHGDMEALVYYGNKELDFQLLEIKESKNFSEKEKEE